MIFVITVMAASSCRRVSLTTAALSVVVLFLLLVPSSGGGGGGGGGGGEKSVGGCSEDNIVVYQGASTPLPNGIPTYTVELHNTCLGRDEGCGGGIANIHLTCGWFSSARLINPKVFRRLGDNDCLVNDGRPIPAGSSISFQYADTFSYPLAVSSVSCIP